MRLIPFALVGLLTAGCGGDDAEDTEPIQTEQRSAPEVPADTLAGDTIASSDEPSGATAEADARDPAGPPPTDGRASARGVDGQRLYTVQVAAFAEPASATEWEERLQRQGLPVWTSVAEVGGQTFYRLRVGAAPSVSEARRVGGMIMKRYEWPVWIAPVTAADRPPEDALQMTRTLIESE